MRCVLYASFYSAVHISTGPSTQKKCTYSAVSFLPPPRDGVNVEEEKRCVTGVLRCGGLLSATEMFLSPTARPSIFSTA